MNILDEVKTRLSITGTDLDGTIQGMIDDVISYCRSAGLKYTQIVSTRAVGLIARGVADLWNYGAGNGKFSDIFQLRLNQMTLDAASLDHDVESQEKSVTITENGTTEVTPDDGYVLSSVTVDVDVPSKPEQAKSVTITENGTTEITPDEGHVLSGVTVNVSITSNYNTLIPSYDNANISPYIYQHITKINLDGVRTSGNSLSSMFNDCFALKEVAWGDFFESFSPGTSLNVNEMFRYCESLENVDLTGFRGLNLSSVKDMFYKATMLKSADFSGVNITAAGLRNLFNGCGALEYVNLSGSTLEGLYDLTNTFFNCTSLTNIVLADGCFSNSDLSVIDLSYCPLTRDCAVDIFNKLATRTNAPTIKLSTTTKGYLTGNDIAIATAKGWVVS